MYLLIHRESGTVNNIDVIIESSNKQEFGVRWSPKDE
jgi:hypothetical protein